MFFAAVWFMLLCVFAAVQVLLLCGFCGCVVFAAVSFLPSCLVVVAAIIGTGGNVFDPPEQAKK